VSIQFVSEFYYYHYLLDKNDPGKYRKLISKYVK